jgi:nitrogen fixation protein FixH
MSGSRPLSGRKVLMIALGAFGVVIFANVTLAVYAVRSFSGLVVPNSYVASQDFDARRDAQAALGWALDLGYADGALRLAITDLAGRAVRPATLGVTVGRPTTTRDDHRLALEPTVGGYAGALQLPRGAWRVEVVATADDGTAFYQSRELRVAP